MKRITTFLNCRQCNVLGRAQKLEAGLTSDGLQIWCKRCDREVGHFTAEKVAELVAHPPGCECCRERREMS